MDIKSPTIKKGRGRGRGVLALTSFEPLPRPNKTLQSNNKPLNNITNNDQKVNGNQKPTKDIRSNVTVHKINTPNKHDIDGLQILAKYNFTGNPDKPGGFEELCMKQGDKLTLLNKGHAPSGNYLWWEVRNDDGKQGFVPANYCLILETKPTELPWLESKRLVEEKSQQEEEKRRKETTPGVFGAPLDTNARKTVIKQYKSAYTENQVKPAPGSKKLYYCDICDKQLNGPTPYNMHMASKMHREEEEYLKSIAS